MFPNLSDDNRTTVAALAGFIALVLLAGVVTAFVKASDDKPSPEEVLQQQQEEQRRQAEQATADAQARAEQDRKALSAIERQLEECRTKYLPDANQRAEAARQQLKELEASLNRIIAELPPGRAKDLLTAQLPPDVASAEQLINAEQQSMETRCKMANTIFQYTRETVPPPP
ncbi:MAG: hypothetical protein M3179_02645 [Actinomycetota bacterium]|nr:hypothetical protein [Actinomycetota bacterium]